ncbi:YcaO-like family protein [Arthrobacter sp. CG_A4]|uniref:YcaO-like family protein n=1 Tax=Arthrobacter sp. CG_A4 TaxID=3071706 RepID=UPI002DFF88A5|nr:ribosomal protein S12 methylthiotransferase accessory factor [Arthrobacter sp. CG_A4]
MTVRPSIDDLVGPITRVQHLKHRFPEPLGLQTYTAFLADPSAYLNWTSDPFGTGCGFDSDLAYHSSIGEAFERYSGNHVPSGLLTTSYDALSARSSNAVNPGDFFPFADDLPAVQSGQFTRPRADSEMKWVEAESVHGSTLVPAALVYLNYYRSVPAEKRHFPVMLPGISTGITSESALMSSLLEVLERDATMLWWIGRGTSALVETSRAQNIRLQSQTPDRFASSIHLLATYDLGRTAYVVAYVLEDLESSSIQVGFACRFDIQVAISKACAEAWQLSRIAEAVSDSDSWIWRKRSDGTRLNPLLDKDIQSYRQMTQLIHNIQFYLDPINVTLAKREILEGIDREASVEDLQTGNTDLKVDVSRLKDAHGLDIFWRDVTTSDVSSLGYRVVRAFSPQAVPNLATAYPPLGNARLQEQIEASNSDGPRLIPLPHA